MLRQITFITLFLCILSNPTIDLQFEELASYNESNSFHISLLPEQSSYSIHLTLARGLATIKEIYTDPELTTPLSPSEYTTDLIQRKMIFTVPNPMVTDFYFNVECFDCFYFVQARNNEFLQEQELFTNITNYELIPHNIPITFTVKNTTSYSSYSNYQMFITAYNCILNVKDESTTQTYEGDFIAIHDKGSEHNFTYTINVVYMNNDELNCKIMADVGNELKTFTLTEGTVHKFVFPPSVKYGASVMFKHYISNKPFNVFINNYKEGILDIRCSGRNSTKAMLNTMTRDTFTITPVNNAYHCGCFSSDQDDNLREFSVVIRENSSFPLYFNNSTFIRDYLQPKEKKVFVTTVYDFEGSLMIHQPNSLGNVCVSIKEHDTIDENANWMNKVNLNTLCTVDNIEINDQNDMNIAIMKHHTEKCAVNGCEMYITIENTDESDNSHFEEFTFYLQSKSQVNEVPFGEAIIGSFNVNESTVYAYKSKVTYNVQSILINFESDDNEMILYINEDSEEIPTSEQHSYMITNDTMSVILNAKSGNFQNKVISFAVYPSNNMHKYKSEFKISAIPQYPGNSTTTRVKFGEAEYGYIHSSENETYSDFITWIPIRNNQYDFVFHVEFPGDNTLRAQSIYARKIPVGSNYFSSGNNKKTFFEYNHTSISKVYEEINTENENDYVFNNTNSLYIPTNYEDTDAHVIFIRVYLPMDTKKVKLHTNWYHPKSQVKISYLFEKKYFYISQNSELHLQFDLYEDFEVEFNTVNERSSDIKVNSTLTPIYTDGVYHRFSGNYSSNNELIIKTNEAHSTNVYIMSLNSNKIPSELNAINQTATLHMTDDSPSFRYMFLPIPRDDLKLDISFASASRTSDYCSLFNEKGYVVDSEWYHQRMLNDSIEVMEVVKTNNSGCKDNNVELLFNTTDVEGTEQLYLYLEINKINPGNVDVHLELKVNTGNNTEDEDENDSSIVIGLVITICVLLIVIGILLFVRRFKRLKGGLNEKLNV